MRLRSAGYRPRSGTLVRVTIDVRAALDMAADDAELVYGRRASDPGRRTIASVPEPTTHGDPTISPRASRPPLLSLAGSPDPVRTRLGAVTVAVESGRYRVQVEIARDDDQAMGLAEGPLLASVARRLVAEATLQALALFGMGADCAAIDAVAVESLGAHTVALVTVLIAAGTHEEAHVGAAVVRTSGEHDAIARAVLDATNRRLTARV